MNGTVEFLLLISVIIFAAKVGGLISTRLGQPAVLGQLLAGLVLGPSLLDLLHNPTFASDTTGELVLQLGELGVIFLMFTAGLEVDMDQMLQSGRVALLAGTLGVLVPLLLGTLAALAFNFPLLNSIFIGLILTATSVSISAQTLLELGVLQSKEGLALLGAAVIDDVLGILLLSVYLALGQTTGGGTTGIIMVVLRMGLFFAITIGFGVFALPHLTRWVDRLPVSEGVMTLVIVVTLMYAWLAQALGEVAAITGAFIAGALFARTTVQRTIARGMHTLTYAFFVPVFLISVGLQANARQLNQDMLLFALAITVVAVIGKVAGCWLGARAGGFDAGEALRVGVGMISRGEVGLIIAAIGLGSAWIDEPVYSTIILMVLATTLITPLFLRRVFPDAKEEEEITGEPQERKLVEVNPVPVSSRDHRPRTATAIIAADEDGSASS